MEQHDMLGKIYFGNNGTRLVIVTYQLEDGTSDWYELEGGPFDWGTMNTRAHRLANAILRDLGANMGTQVQYSQQLLLNLIAMQSRSSRLCIEEATVLTSLGCKAIDDLCKIKG